MFLIEIHPGNDLPTLSLRDSEFKEVTQEFVNGLKAYIIDEVQDAELQAAYCTAINAKRFLIKNQVIDEVVFDGVSVLTNAAPNKEDSAALVYDNQHEDKHLAKQEQPAEVINARPVVNYEGISDLDLSRALQEQIEVIKYLTALNNHIASLAQTFLSEIPERRAQLDHVESLLSSIVSNPLLGVAKRNELGELTLSQTELDNLMAMFVSSAH